MARGAGFLRDEVTLKTANPSVDGTGDGALTTVRTQWCRIEPAGGRAVEIGMATGDVTTHKITFRFAPEVESRHLIVDAAGVTYQVQSIGRDRVRDEQVVFAEARLQ